jgi:hypothetical protein
VHDLLAHERDRLLSARTTVSRSVVLRRMRRRVMPPLIAGSGALVGSGLIAAWVSAQPGVGASATTPPATTSPATGAAGSQQEQLSTDVTALDQLRQVLASDEAAIAGMSASTAVAPGAGASTGRTTSPGRTPQPSGSVAGAASLGAGPTGGAATSPVPTVTVPGLAPLPTIPAATPPTTAPPTHTTTGATVVAP